MRHREKKTKLLNLIDDIKEQFQKQLPEDDALLKEKEKLEKKLAGHQEAELDVVSDEEREQNKKQREKIMREIKTVEDKIEEKKVFFPNYNAFEWRLVFPELLDNKVEYQGFDVIIGNPPYINAPAYGRKITTGKGSNTGMRQI